MLIDKRIHFFLYFRCLSFLSFSWFLINCSIELLDLQSNKIGVLQMIVERQKKEVKEESFNKYKEAPRQQWHLYILTIFPQFSPFSLLPLHSPQLQLIKRTIFFFCIYLSLFFPWIKRTWITIQSRNLINMKNKNIDGKINPEKYN